MGLDDEKNLGNLNKPKERESIKAAATRYGDEIFTGAFHGDSYAAFLAAHPESEGVSEQDLGLENGFLTSNGRFVSSQEALEIAWHSKQVAPDVMHRRSRLLSDDLIRKQHPVESKERIVSAAIKYKDEIFMGKTHADAWVPLTEKYANAVITNERTDGFVTSTGRFVNRKDALEIADDADQLRSFAPFQSGELGSEHLKDTE